jgi:hypothetical protein
MIKLATKTKLLPGAAVLGVLLVSALAPPGTPLGALAGYSYGYVGGLGGTLLGGPGAGSTTQWTQVYVLGTDYGIYYRVFDGSNWSGWGKIQDGTGISNPSAVGVKGVGYNESDVFVVGTDHAVWHAYFAPMGIALPCQGGCWESWGGFGASDPAATSIASGELDMVVRGTDSGLWLRQETSFFSLGTWARIPQATATSDAGVASAAPNELDVFTRGTDNQLWFLRSTVAAGWMLPWTPLGGALTSGPDAASCTPGHMDVVVRGTDNGYWRRGWNGTSWTPWQELTADSSGQQVSGTWTSDPSITCGGAAGMYVFGRDSSGALTYFTESPT